MNNIIGNKLYADQAHCEAAYLLPRPIVLSNEVYGYFHELQQRRLQALPHLDGPDVEAAWRQVELIDDMARTVVAFMAGGEQAARRVAGAQITLVPEQSGEQPAA